MGVSECSIESGGNEATRQQVRCQLPPNPHQRPVNAHTHTHTHTHIQRWNKPVKKERKGGGKCLKKPSASNEREEEWRCGGQTRPFRKIKALSPTGCKSPIEYGEGALEQPTPSPLVGYKETHDLQGGVRWNNKINRLPGS